MVLDLYSQGIVGWAMAERMTRERAMPGLTAQGRRASSKSKMDKNPLKQDERVMGIEPTLSAWEAEVLPLNYTRIEGGLSGGF